jgi:serine/threonine protein kinase
MVSKMTYYQSTQHQSIQSASPLIGCSVGEHGRYQIEVHLGKGGMGDVYQAIDTRLGKDVAIKLLDVSLSGVSTTAALDFKRRFERECAICAALRSEHIVQVSDYGITDEGQPFYIMEYLVGQTLEQVLKQESKLSVERTKHIMMQVCAGLRSAHEGAIFRTPGASTNQCTKIIHRDLKPANIFLTASDLGEHAKIIDFGVAKIQSLHQDNANLTNVFLGTHHYAAPEQFDHLAHIDERSDIYCLGLILYEMLTGVDPFGLKDRGQKVTGESWVKAHLLQAVLPLRSRKGCEHLSAELERIVIKCLEKRPGDRFSSVQSLAQALNTEQSWTSPKILLGNILEQNKNKISHSFSLALKSFQLERKFRNMQEWILENFDFNRNSSLFQTLPEPKPIESFPSYASSRFFLPTPFTLSDFNLELIDKCQLELAIYIGPIAKLVVERTLSDIQYHQAQKFIEALASQIPDIDAARHFRRTFLASNSVPEG